MRRRSWRRGFPPSAAGRYHADPRGAPATALCIADPRGAAATARPARGTFAARNRSGAVWRHTGRDTPVRYNCGLLRPRPGTPAEGEAPHPFRGRFMSIEHENFIKTPRQLILIGALAFIVPITL